MKLTVKLKTADLEAFIYAPELFALSCFVRQQEPSCDTDAVHTMLENMGMDGVSYRFNVDFSLMGVTEEDVDKCIKDMEQDLSGEKAFKKIEKEIDNLEKLLASLG
jgi:hypothetical protein